MALSCPRCSTDVPDGALYCPYCNLPKPKRGFTASVEGAKNNVPPVASAARAPQRRRPPHARTNMHSRTSKPRRSFKLPAIGALVALLSAGAYFFLVPLVYSESAEPKAVLAALDNLRKTPSNEEGVSIDARMSRELDRSRRAGDLREYQGWTAKPIKGTRHKVLLVFSFEEAAGHRSAEWIADLAHNTFVPQNELAVSVSR